LFTIYKKTFIWENPTIIREKKADKVINSNLVVYHELSKTMKNWDVSINEEVNLENDGDLYSACSNPIIVQSLAAILAGGWPADMMQQLWCSKNRASLRIFMPKTITGTILMRSEHAL
jgi:hypothetical protein